MIFIKNAHIFTLDSQYRVFKSGGIAIEGDSIIEIGDTDSLARKYSNAEHVIDASSKIVIPGLINCHNHMFQTLLRGAGNGLPLDVWLPQVIWPLSKKLRRKAAYVGSQLSCLEMIKTGTTCVSDCMFINVDKSNLDETARGVLESGMRGVLGRGTIDTGPAPEEFKESPEAAVSEIKAAISKWNDKENGRIRVVPFAQSEVNASLSLMKALKELSKEMGTFFHMHAAETKERVQGMQKSHGVGTVEYLYNEHLLDAKTLLAHCVWVSDKEIALLRSTDTKIVHNPVSNEIAGDGVAPVPEMLRNGVCVSLGTDGAASNNSQDMFQVMKAAALLQKVHHLDPAIISSQTVLEMATKKGAESLGLLTETGSLEVGKRADLTIIDKKIPEMVPWIYSEANIVYSITGSAVDTVIIDGKVVMMDRKVRTLDEEKVLNMANDVASELASAS